MAIIGLGLSGDRSGGEALRELLGPAPTPTATEFREQMSGVILEALKANQTIAQQGLAIYYRNSTLSRVVAFRVGLRRWFGFGVSGQ